MLLIQSAQTDSSTNDVLDWLYYLYPHLNSQRLNDRVEVKKISHSISNQGERLHIETTAAQIIDTGTASARWYRRGNFGFKPIQPGRDTSDNAILSRRATNYVQQELAGVDAGIDNALSRLNNSLNRFRDNATDKTDNLVLAASSGLQIPDTLITNDAAELAAFADKHGRIITKAFAKNLFRIPFEQHIEAGISSDTTLIHADRLPAAARDANPLPAFYQQYIDKKIELRIFYLKGSFYSMAIFSQANEKTQIDFRNYDRERPNRCVPYKLPLETENKLSAFMQSAGLNSGSIDMILTPQKEYVFLEVNPIGQFQWLSQNCNYDIERRIAHDLAQTTT